jgi:hypothetical protein
VANLKKNRCLYISPHNPSSCDHLDSAASVVVLHHGRTCCSGRLVRLNKASCMDRCPLPCCKLITSHGCVSHSIIMLSRSASRSQQPRPIDEPAQCRRAVTGTSRSTTCADHLQTAAPVPPVADVTYHQPGRHPRSGYHVSGGLECPHQTAMATSAAMHRGLLFGLSRGLLQLLPELWLVPAAGQAPWM